MNYIGSKVSLLDFIDKTIEEVVDKDVLSNPDKHIFTDLFAETNSVGAYFKRKSN